MSTRRTRVALPVSPRAPTKDGLLDWVQKELHQFLIQVRDVINYISGKVAVDKADADAGGHGFLTTKLLVDGTMTRTVATDHSTVTLGVTPGTIPAADDHKVSTDATDEAAAGAGYLLAKHSNAGNVQFSLDSTSGRKVKASVTLPTGFPGYYEYNPEPDGVATPGDDARVSHGNHVHPLAPTPQITNVFYLEPGLGQHHLVNPCPSTVSSVQFAFPTTPAATTSSVAAVTLNSQPGLVDWAGGTCNVVLRAKVVNLIGTTHQIAVDLHRIPVGGGAGTRYCNAVQPWVGPTDILTDDIQVLRFAVPVKFLTGPATDLLQVTIYALSGLGGSVDTEIMYVETGADGSTVLVNDATQIQTLFGSSSGGPIEHNQTTGRDVDYSLGGCHPADAVGPGRLHRNMGVATESSGKATMPSDASQASLTLAGSYLYSIDSTGFVHGDPIMVFIDNATAVTPKWLVDGASNVGAFYGLKLAMLGGTVSNIGMKGKTTCLFWLDGVNSCWRSPSLPVTHFDP